MAFSQAPQYNTYQQKTIEFDGTPLYRYGDLSIERDIQMINLTYEQISQENKEREVYLKKRPGLTASAYSLSKTSNTDPVRGSFYDVEENAFYWAVKDKVYRLAPDVSSTARSVCTLTTTTGYVGFSSYFKSDSTRYILISDGTDLWVDDFAAGSPACTSVPHSGFFPSPHQPYPIYLDGYVFLLGADSSDIWNSEIDDPTLWTNDSPMQAEIHSDYAKRIIKAKNYLVVLGSNSAEYFWDAGNTTGSPLSRNDSPVRNVGYITGLCTIEDITYFVGQDEKRNTAVYAITSFKIERISNAVVDRTLQSYQSTDNQKGNVYLQTDGYALSVDGHSYYVLVTPQTTWLYDLDAKFWYEWRTSDGSGIKFEAVWGMYNGNVYCAIKNQEDFSILSPTIYQDFGSNFTCRYTTEDIFLDTFNWKFLHRVSLISGRWRATGSSNVALYWSTDDWAPGSTKGPRYLNVFGNSPCTHRLGKFRNVSFKLEYSDNYPFDMRQLQLDINIGTI